jgi:hypothetical protein
MQIRRPMVALMTALVLASGCGALTACGDPVNSNTGTTKDTSTNTSGNNPSGKSQGNLPDNSTPGNTEDKNDDQQDPD